VAKVAKKSTPEPEHHGASLGAVHGTSSRDEASPSLSPVPYASPSLYVSHRSPSQSPRTPKAPSTSPEHHQHSHHPQHHNRQHQNTNTTSSSSSNHNQSIDRVDASAENVLEQLRLARMRLNRKQRSIEREIVVGADMLRQSGQVFAANDLAREQARNHLH